MHAAPLARWDKGSNRGAKLVALAALLVAASPPAGAAPVSIGAVHDQGPPFRSSTPFFKAIGFIHIMPSRGRAPGGVLMRYRR
jgi:hypothetical protein